MTGTSADGTQLQFQLVATECATALALYGPKEIIMKLSNIITMIQYKNKLVLTEAYKIKILLLLLNKVLQ